jgi:hypothetical protein
VLTVVFIRGWRKNPGSPVLMMVLVTTLIVWQDPIMNWSPYAVYNPMLLHWPESWYLIMMSPTVEPFTPSVPAPFAPGAPAPFAPPAPFPTEFPFAPPAPAPFPTGIPFAPPSVGPGSTPFPFLPPLPGLTPFNPTGVGYNPLPAQFAQPAKPPSDQDRCRCTAEKKRKRKKREDRKVCWQGTYREMARGVIKHRKERVSCRP